MNILMETQQSKVFPYEKKENTKRCLNAYMLFLNVNNFAEAQQCKIFPYKKRKTCNII